MGVPLRRDVFIKFLNDKVENAACGACGTTNWIVREVDKGMLVSVLLDQQRGFNISPLGIPAGIVACSNCSNLRFHAIGVIKLPVSVDSARTFERLAALGADSVDITQARIDRFIAGALERDCQTMSPARATPEVIN